MQRLIAFTLIVIKPINDQLLREGLDPSDPEVPELLRSWGALHGVRSATSALAFLFFLLA